MTFLTHVFVHASTDLPVRRYRKGKTSVLGNLWWEMHEECMIVCAEAVIPLSITAVVSTGGSHDSAHARWGEEALVRVRNGAVQ